VAPQISAPAGPAYGTGGLARSRARIVHVAFWLTLVYTIGVVAWWSVDRRFINMTRQSVEGVSLSESFVTCLWGFSLAPIAMSLANVLATVAYFKASRGRAGGGTLLIAYVVLQAALAIIMMSSIVSLVSMGRIEYFRHGAPSIMIVSSTLVPKAALLAAGLCVPAVGLLVPSVRRALFRPPGGN
jgi:hypothetical protein